MDVRISAGDELFTLRAAALIIHNDCLLMVKDAKHDSYYTVGGKVHLGESSQQAARREACEETGCRLSVNRLLFVQERFFTFEQKQHHEICFYYLMDFDDESIREGAHTDQHFETLHYLPIRDLSQYNIVPAFLKSALQHLPAQPQHIICRE